MMEGLRKTLLIIDDDQLFCKSTAAYLTDRDYTTLAVNTLSEGENICAKRKVDVILLDQKLPDGDGIDLCRTILDKHEQVKIIFITAFPNFDHAVKALRNGAFDYLSKPIEIEELALTVDQAFRTLKLETVEQIHNYKDQQEVDRNVLIGKHSGLKNIFHFIKLAAANDVPVLITGETGTGKNVVAKNIHYLNTARFGCIMGINCAALPENLIEAELFGYEKGAFTGAESARKGIFELADGGTLFLDEIGDLPLHLQAKLLGFLDEQRFKRLGGQSFTTVSVRIIAATNVDLEQAVHNKAFRQDLYYRLSVLPIHVPPLRERKEDIPELCQFFISFAGHQHHVSLSSDEIMKLQQYDWPGNVRELKNIIERALVFKRNGHIYPSELLQENITKNSVQATHQNTSIQTLEDVEKEHILMVLSQLGNNHTKASEALGISRSTLLRKLKVYSATQPRIS